MLRPNLRCWCLLE